MVINSTEEGRFTGCVVLHRHEFASSLNLNLQDGLGGNGGVLKPAPMMK